MIYYIKHANKNFFDKDIKILNEYESAQYVLRASGSVFKRLFYPDLSVQNTTGVELLYAKSDRKFIRRKHNLMNGAEYKGCVEELSFFSYLLKLTNSDPYKIKIRGLFKTRFELKGHNGAVASVIQELRKNRWRIELFNQNEKLCILAGIALMYCYFNSFGDG